MVEWITSDTPVPYPEAIAWMEARAAAIVKAVTHYNDPKMLAQVSENLGEAMVGINAGPGFITFCNRDS